LFRELLTGVAHPPVQSGFEDEIFQIVIIGEAVVAVGTAGEILQIGGDEMFFTLRTAVAFEHERGFFLIICIFHTINLPCYLKNRFLSIILFKIAHPREIVKSPEH
jgi:hypothetical protein